MEPLLTGLCIVLGANITDLELKRFNEAFLNGSLLTRRGMRHDVNRYLRCIACLNEFDVASRCLTLQIEGTQCLCFTAYGELLFEDDLDDGADTNKIRSMVARQLGIDDDDVFSTVDPTVILFRLSKSFLWRWQVVDACSYDYDLIYITFNMMIRYHL